ncbi:hypothetical protein DFP94_102248 [Fontibacillus phaseoli]|uniref:Uncharacterized protein n=1 Tax=Fontibacillus phaseoli TaxID=1416533 RepID=A0A369BK57_9BACL|nr:hypothetical protein DFP94_102248 [Fontibacillus phaseoli]
MPVKGKVESSRTQINVLIPVIEKDLETLPYVIDGIRKYVQHPIEYGSLSFHERNGYVRKTGVSSR